MIQTAILLINLFCFGLLFHATRNASTASANTLYEVAGNKSRLGQLNQKHLISTCAIVLVSIIHSAYEQSMVEWFRFPGIKVFFPVLTISLIALMISSFSSISESNHGKVLSGITSLQYIPAPYSTPVLLSYFLIRTLYLIFYEIFFRLTLIESLSSFTGINPAIIISTIMYGYHHVFSRKTEFYSSFFFGLILCWISWHTCSILPAIFIHLLLSLPYEFRIILYQKTNSI